MSEQDLTYREWQAADLQALGAKLKLLKEHGVARFKDDSLEVEFSEPAQVVALDELLGESKKEKDDQPLPKTPYEQALERAAGQ